MGETITKSIRPELNPYVVFKVLNRGEPKIWDQARHAPIKTGDVYRLRATSSHKVLVCCPHVHYQL